jgi:hypothetical protein
VSVSSLPPPVTRLLSDLFSSRSSLHSQNLALQATEASLRAELAASATQVSSLNARVFSLDESLASVSLSLSSQLATFTAEKQRLTQQRDEFENRSIRLQGRDDQYQAALRKKELDYERLKKAVQSKGSSRPAPPAARSKPPPSSSALPLSGPSRDVYTTLVTSLEFRQAELIDENDELRASLSDLSSSLSDLLSKHETLSDVILQSRLVTATSSLSSAAPPSPLSAPPERFHLPMDYVRENLADAMREKLVKLKERIAAVAELDVAKPAASSSVPNPTADNDELVGRLQAKIAKLQEIVGQQDSLIQQAVFAERTVASQPADDAETLMDLARARREVREERGRLDEEWAELERRKVGEFLESAAAGTLMLPSHRRSSSQGSYSSSTGTPGGENPLLLPFDATPGTREALEGLGVRAGVMPVGSDELFA